MYWRTEITERGIGNGIQSSSSLVSLRPPLRSYHRARHAIPYRVAVIAVLVFAVTFFVVYLLNVVNAVLW